MFTWTCKVRWSMSVTGCPTRWWLGWPNSFCRSTSSSIWAKECSPTDTLQPNLALRSWGSSHESIGNKTANKVDGATSILGNVFCFVFRKRWAAGERLFSLFWAVNTLVPSDVNPSDHVSPTKITNKNNTMSSMRMKPRMCDRSRKV